MLSMGSSPVSRNPSNPDDSQKDAHSVPKYACKDSMHKLDYQIGTMRKVGFYRAPTGQTTLASLSFKDPSRVPEAHRYRRITS